jgi:hypothetical protein
MKTLVSSILVSLLAACGTAHMVVPKDVATGSDIVQATDRSMMSGTFANESFKLGVYAVGDVDRDWDSTSSLGVLSFSTDKTKGGYSYTLKGKDVDLKGGCATESGDDSISLGHGFSAGSAFAKLGCTCSGKGEPTKVVIAASSSEKYAGELHTHGGQYQISAIYETEGALPNGPAGYRIDADGPRGAVEVLKPGRIWFPHDMEEAERADLTCLYAGLMLYMPPEKH